MAHDLATPWRAMPWSMKLRRLPHRTLRDSALPSHRFNVSRSSEYPSVAFPASMSEIASWMYEGQPPGLSLIWLPPSSSDYESRPEWPSNQFHVSSSWTDPGSPEAHFQAPLITTEPQLCDSVDQQQDALSFSLRPIDGQTQLSAFRRWPVSKNGRPRELLTVNPSFERTRPIACSMARLPRCA